MNLHATWRNGLLLVAVTIIQPEASAAATVDKAAIAKTIGANVAQIVAGLNAHDAVRTTAFDAPNIISMECGSPNMIGAKADRDGFSHGFAHDPSWRVGLIDETVDVAGSGDLAVYRGTYNEDNRIGGALMTHKTNFMAEFKHQNDGSWTMHWYIVAS